MASTNRVAWTYTSDASRGGVDYRVSALKTMTDQAVSGGGAAASSVPPKPAGLHMRGVYVSDGAGHLRKAIAYTEDADILTPGTAVTVSILGTATACTSTGTKIPERIRNATTQST